MENGENLRSLIELGELFKYYIISYKSNDVSFRRITSNLADFNIRVSRDKRSENYSYSCTDVDGCVIFYTFSIFYNNEEVARFFDINGDVLSNLEYCMKLFKPGEWTHCFEKVINESINEDNLIKILKK